MSGPIRNGCVARGVAPAATTVTIYTVPSGFGLLLKAAHAQNQSGNAAAVNVTMLDRSGTVQIPIITASIPAWSHGEWSGWTALNELDYLVIHSDQAGTNYWLAGAVLPFAGGIATLPLQSEDVLLADLSPRTREFLAQPLADTPPSPPPPPRTKRK